MKKWLIGSLVGAILLFAWQFLSWTVLQIHSGEAKFTAAQNDIISYLSTNLKEDGVYMVPTVQPGATMDEQNEFAKSRDGKPMATVVYRNAYKNEMAMPMIRAFLVNVFLVFSLIYVLTRGGTPPGIRIFAGSVAVGLITFLYGPYTMHIWYQTPTESYTGHLIDALVAWGLVGIWLNWWLKRSK